MKNILLLVIAIISAFVLQAQDKNEDTTKIKWLNGKKIWIFKDKEIAQKDSIRKEKKKGANFTHWRGFDVGICALSTAKNKFQIPVNDDVYNINYFLNLKYNRSWYFSFNPLEKSIHLYKNYINIITGLGIEWNSYNFRSNILLTSDSSHINATTIQMDTMPNVKYIKNQLKASYIKIPLIIELNTNNSNADKSFHLAAGMEFGYKIGSWTKRKYEQERTTYKAKFHDDYNLSAFKYGVVVRAGYGGFTLFANYSLSPLFDKNKGPEIEIYPLSMGIAFSF
ncbi:MAG: outer membrane beta-barrel protein [Bacteroidetes bacterium]|nr:outer membrane beta-barrel protein [Bacteroidota bacterium]